MSKLIHNIYSAFDPIFNSTFEKLQKDDISVFSDDNSTLRIGEVVERIGCKKPMFVTDKGIVSLGLLKNAISSLEIRNISYHIFDGVTPDPTTDVVEKGVKEFLENKCDSIISFGGGSPIDAAKVIAGLAKNTNINNYMGISKMLSFSKKNGVYPIICVPTTAGTGAEVTMGAVISNSKTKQKGIVIDKGFISENVFLDPNLTLGIPKHITSSCAFDALTHALEAYVSKFSNKTTKKYSLDAINKIFKYLPIAYQDGKNIEARKNLLVASHEAGRAIGRAHIGSVHSIGHNIGAKYKIPHGLAVAVALPHVFEVYKKNCPKVVGELALELNIGDKSDSLETLCDKLIDKLIKLAKEVEIPNKLEVLSEDRRDLVNLMIKESYLYPVPTYISKSEFTDILHKILK